MSGTDEMLFFLLVVTPITIIVWLLIKLVRPKSRISFDRLGDGIGIAICMTYAVGFILAIIGTVVYQLYRHYPWVLAILAAWWIVVGFASLIAHLTRKARQRQRQEQTLT